MWEIFTRLIFAVYEIDHEYTENFNPAKIPHEFCQKA